MKQAQAPAVFSEQERCGIPHVRVLARQDGCGEYAFDATAPHDTPVMQHPSRQRPPSRQQLLFSILVKQIRWLQCLARYLLDTPL